MNFKESFGKSPRSGKLTRLKEHFKKRQSAIALLLMFTICAGTFPILIRCSQPQAPKTEITPEIEEQLEQPPLPQEVVHEDLGDAPVIKEEHVTLN